MQSTQTTKTSNDKKEIVSIAAKAGTFLGSAAIASNIFENNTLEPVTKYLQQFAVDITSEINPMLSIYAASPIGDHISNVVGAATLFGVLCYGLQIFYSLQAFQFILHFQNQNVARFAFFHIIWKAWKTFY